MAEPIPIFVAHDRLKQIGHFSSDDPAFNQIAAMLAEGGVLALQGGVVKLPDGTVKLVEVSIVSQAADKR